MGRSQSDELPDEHLKNQFWPFLAAGRQGIGLHRSPKDGRMLPPPAQAVDESYASAVSELYIMRRLAARVLISPGGWAAINAGNPMISHNTT